MIDNDRMWESLIRHAIRKDDNWALVSLLIDSLKDQGLQYNSETRNIERIINSHLYVCMKVIPGCSLYEKDKIYEISDSEAYRINSALIFCEHFRPVTLEEIGHVKGELGLCP